jgi:hypothetical protein
MQKVNHVYSCAVVGQVHSWKLWGVVISHLFAFSESRCLKLSYKSIGNACTAFSSTLVSMLELSLPLPVLLLLRVGGLSRLTGALQMFICFEYTSYLGILLSTVIILSLGPWSFVKRFVLLRDWFSIWIKFCTTEYIWLPSPYSTGKWFAVDSI